MHNLPTVTCSHSVEPNLYPEVDARLVRVHPSIFHPELGWGVIDVVNAREFRVRFEGVLAWFSLSDEVVSRWPVQRAAALARWIRRVSPS